MATKQLSPTGRILRHSRLFALPPPLARPNANSTSTDRYDSETATLPYPTHAALETTPPALAKGDWGLKQSLPLQSTAQTSTPTIRIRDIDTINHITDFESAADHVLNLKKWQEIGLPISRLEIPDKRVTPGTGQQVFKPHKSVFESDCDNTEGHGPANKGSRWKYKGPWLAGQTQGEFQDYVRKNMKKRKGEFQDFLRAQLSQKMTRDRDRAALDSGTEADAEPVEVSDKDLRIYIKRLRQDQDALFALIEEFLDLPSSEEAPPTTQPSAGISYLRTNAYTPNHPVLGPQAKRRPIRGRVLLPRSARPKAMIGVGGIVAEDYKDRGYKHVDAPGTDALDPQLPGGAKIWVTPTRTSVDAQGRVLLSLDRADRQTVALYEERSPEEPMPSHITSGQKEIPNLVPSRSPSTSARGHGYGLLESAKSTPDVQESSAKGRRNPTSSTDSILDMLVTGNRRVNRR
ncbi:MAG: hypothetical protein Q9191_006036 [Dirinaria sp. TL-2023a]